MENANYDKKGVCTKIANYINIYSITAKYVYP